MPDDRDDDAEDLDRPPPFFPYDEDEEPEPNTFDAGDPVEVAVEGVFFAEANGLVQRFVLLSDGERRLPIHIGAPEATSISLPLEGSKPDRPMTHDLLKAVIDRLGATVNRVVIDDLWNKTYYAKIYVQLGEEEMEIDSRPSDAIALALRSGVSVYVCDGILEQGAE